MICRHCKKQDHAACSNCDCQHRATIAKQDASGVCVVVPIRDDGTVNQEGMIERGHGW